MKKNRICVVVEDLLPVYLEGLTNDTTNKMIEEHIRNCEQCRKYNENLAVSNEQLVRNEEDKSRSFKKQLYRYRYQLLGLFLGMSLTVVAVFGSITFAIYWLRMADQTNSHTEELSEYRKFDDYYGISKLYLFPGVSIKKEENVKINQYVYDCQNSKRYQTCQIFLECEYSKEMYKEEKKRVLKVEDRETGLRALYTVEKFPYPAAYAMHNSDGCYEYVLFLEKEQKIIYVYVQGYIDRRDLLFPEKYLPCTYGQNGIDYEMETEGYSIYPVYTPMLEEE